MNTYQITAIRPSAEPYGPHEVEALVLAESEDKAITKFCNLYYFDAGDLNTIELYEEDTESTEL